MKSAIHNLRAAIVVVLFCLPAAWPYLGGDLPRTNDTRFHYYRAVELDRLVRSGDLFPRWGPDFAHGYGYPVFNFFPYLAHYLIVLFHFTGLSFLWALRATYLTAIIGGGLSAFGLGQALSPDPVPTEINLHWERREISGLVTALAFVYSPYVIYTTQVRGSLPESLALAFLPLALWAIHDSLSQPNRSLRPQLSAGVGSLAIAGFVAAHVGMAIQYLPFICLWGAFCIFRAYWIEVKDSSPWRPHSLTPLLKPLLTFILIITFGLALTAFLWLPSVAELPYVQFETAFARAGLVYTQNFARWPDLLTYPSLPVYTAILNPPIVRSLSIPVVVIALSGVVLRKRLSRSQQITYLFLLLAFLSVCFLTLDLSKPIWDSIGLLQRSTFPWRFLGLASLVGAMLAGVVVGHWSLVISRWSPVVGRWSLTFYSFVIVSLFISSTPFLFPPREPTLENPTLADLARFEIPPLLVATTTTGEFTPIWVKEFPDTTEMQTALLAGQQPERLDAPGATIKHLTAEPAHDSYQLNLSQPLTATYRTFYFPGWVATLDGQPLKLRPSEPNGLITFAIPAGEHTLEIRFGSTPIRTTAGWISVAAWLLVIGGLVLAYWRTRELDDSRSVSDLRLSRIEREIGVQSLPTSGKIRRFCSPSPLKSGGPDLQNVGSRFVFGVLGFCFLGFFSSSLFITNPGPPQTQHPLNLDFDGELILVGYNQSNRHAERLTANIDLVWQAQQPLGVPYGFNVRLTDDRGLSYSDTNIERPHDWRFYPGTDFWPPDQFIRDSYILKPLSGTPPGSYHLEVSAYRADTLQSLATRIIGEYQIEVPTNEPLTDPLLTFAGAALIGIQADRADAAPGDPYRLTLRWQAVTDSPPDQATELELIDSTGTRVYTRTESVSPTYAPSRWKVGDVLSQEVFFRLPAGLPGGDFHWRVGGAEIQAPAAVTLRLHAPTRSFDLPTLAHPQTVELTPSIKLLGWNEPIDSQSLTIELAWQATQAMDTSYRVFLHLLDAGGNLVSQSDGEPANWTRPTTSWLPGEVVLDARTLTTPGPGVYSLAVGWVDAAGERVGGPVTLGEIRVP